MNAMNTVNTMNTIEICGKTGCLAVNPTGMTHDDAVAICETLTPIEGIPPEIGWWMCSFAAQVPKMRWWNGEYYSIFCNQTDAALGRLNDHATTQTGYSQTATPIYWTARFWEGK